MTIEVAKFRLSIGKAIDIKTGWDFRLAEHRAAAEEYHAPHKSRLLIGSPMCTIFSTLQNVSPWTSEKQDEWVEVRQHIQFVVKLYRKQLEEGRWFLHEHPTRASSRGLQEVQALAKQKGVAIYEADQCMYGLAVKKAGGGRAAARKATKFMTTW